MVDIYATTIRSLDRLVLVLSWGTALFSVLRFRRFDAQSASLAAFLLLTLWIGGIAAVMIFSRRFLHAEQGLSVRRFLLFLERNRWFRLGKLFWRKNVLWFRKNVQKKYIRRYTRQLQNRFQENFWEHMRRRRINGIGFWGNPPRNCPTKAERLAKSESRIEKAIFLGPGLLLGLFLVLPSCRVSGVVIYFMVFGIIFSCFDRMRAAPQRIVQETEPEIDAEPEEIDDEPWDEKTLLRMIRTKDENGEEQLQAWMQTEFLKNQRTVNVHLPFFPVPDHVPQVEVLQFQGEHVDIKIAHLSTMGVRIDLKRPARRKTQESVGIFIAVNGIIS